ncbi:MAG: chitobiase/beta-hexosaminidase C-terminal domain-containing protein [Lachnospiraceae bacterium]|nr:chitobiase/beta-hexosaminidase C-terminal domain-containing protein [Lachnospiraceae bacterium]
MICPKCGAEIREGFLYCSECGEEIKIVPDFEVELEVGIEETISEVAELIADSVEDETSGEESVPVDVKRSDEKKTRSYIGPGLLVVCALIAALALSFGIYRIVRYFNDYYSYDVQYARAQSLFDEGDYESAVSAARHTVSLNRKETGPRLLLADSYYRLDKYDESIAVLNDLLNDRPHDMAVYERLLENYEKEGDTDSIIRLSEGVKDPDIRKMFEGYVSNAPQFGTDAGIYYEPVELSLSAEGEGQIRYTVDGNEPDIGSALYTGPIKIDEGETTVWAVFVNEKGIISESVSKNYIVEKIQTAPPRIVTQPGSYSIPQLIKVEEPIEGVIHYTSDGSEPDGSSDEYEPPVLMPLGKSEFKFITVTPSGGTSDVVSAQYDLKISGIVDASYAQSAVQMKLISIGKPVMDHTFKAAYGYSNEGRSYYVIEEYSGSSRLGNMYAVDAQSAEVFTLTRNKARGNYDFGIVNPF